MTGPELYREAVSLAHDDPGCACETTCCIHEQVQLQRAGVMAFSISSLEANIPARIRRLRASCRAVVEFQSLAYRPAWTIDGKRARRILASLPA